MTRRPSRRAGEDGEAASLPFTRAQVVVAPMPVPIEGLESLRAATGTGEQLVPIVGECVEGFAAADDLEHARGGCVRRNGGAGTAGAATSA